MPLVEFELVDGLSDEEAQKHIEAEVAIDDTHDSRKCYPYSSMTLWKMYKRLISIRVIPSMCSANYCRSMRCENFLPPLLKTTQQGGVQAPLKLSASILDKIPKNEVFVVKWPSEFMKTQYYKTVVPETPIILCKSCNHFFHEEDYELESIRKGHCPFCRAPSQL